MWSVPPALPTPIWKRSWLAILQGPLPSTKLKICIVSTTGSDIVATPGPLVVALATSGPIITALTMHWPFFPQFEAWPPLTGPLLTKNEQAFRSGPQITMSVLKFYSCRDEFNRESRIISQTSSTSIAVRKSSGVSFGLVRFFFSNRFVNTITVFAYIDWYGDPQPLCCWRIPIRTQLYLLIIFLRSW